MSIFGDLVTDDSIKGESDYVGGSLRESGIYDFTVSMAYLSTADSGAKAINVTLKDDQGEVKETIYYTSGTKKGGKNYYERDGKKSYLPGFLTFQTLSRLAAGMELDSLGATVENKVIKIYDYETKKEVPTEVPVIMGLLDKPISVGLLKVTEDKQAKGADGAYHATGQTRDKNEIDKLFRSTDKLTVAEILAGKEEAVFFDQWKTKWEGQVKDKSTKTSSQSTTASFGTGTTAANTAQGEKPKSLFG